MQRKWRDTVEEYFGEDLAAIAAHFAREARYDVGRGDKDVCFFAAGDRLIGIEYGPDGGPHCSVSPPGVSDINDFSTWTSIWVAIGDQPTGETDDALFAWLSKIPSDFAGKASRIGQHLRTLFS